MSVYDKWSKGHKKWINILISCHCHATVYWPCKGSCTCTYASYRYEHKDTFICSSHSISCCLRSICMRYTFIHHNFIHYNITLHAHEAITMCKHPLHTQNKPFLVDSVCVLFWASHVPCTVHSTAFAALLFFQKQGLFLSVPNGRNQVVLNRDGASAAVQRLY